MYLIEEIHAIFTECGSVCTDSRKVQRTPLFFALSGPSFDGNKFAAQALEKGCKYAVIDQVKYKLDDRYILVDDALKALQQLATFHRKQFDIPVIGLTGSNGKTTTKELLKAILSVDFKIAATKGNLNNHIGVPLTLLELDSDTEIAVIEMGTNNHGEIQMLCELALPTHGMITSIGKAHLEGLGSLEGVAKEKLSLFQFVMDAEGTIFYPNSDSFINEFVDQFDDKSIGYSVEKFANYKVQPNALFPLIKGQLIAPGHLNYEFESHLFGKHNLLNIVAALTVGDYFKVPLEKSLDAIQSLTLKNNRAEVVERGSNHIILDAYNANPSSMSETIMAFGAARTEEKVLIVGDMFELGSFTREEHQNIVDLAEQFHWHKLILVGVHFSNCKTKQAESFATYEDVKAWFDLKNFSNKSILIKASRGLALERLIQE